MLDLIQEGTLGLMHAVKKFDQDKGARLAHYATWWIRSYILKFILDNFRMVKIGTTKTQKKLFYNLMREQQKLEAMGYYATPALLSEHLGVDQGQIEEMQKRLAHSEIALETPIKGHGGEESNTTLKDFISDDTLSSETVVGNRQTAELLNQKFKEFAEVLNERELKIFEERLLAQSPKTLQEIATDYGITKERVRQVEEKLIKRLKQFFEESGIKLEDLRR